MFWALRNGGLIICAKVLDMNQENSFSSFRSISIRPYKSMETSSERRSQKSTKTFDKVPIQAISQALTIQCRAKRRAYFGTVQPIPSADWPRDPRYQYLGTFFDSQSTTRMMAVASVDPTFETTLISRSSILLARVGKGILSVGNALLVMSLCGAGCVVCLVSWFGVSCVVHGGLFLL